MISNTVLVQSIGFAGTALFFASYQCKSTRNLFRVQFFSYLFYTIHMIMLGAVTGGFSYVINLMRSFCLAGNNRFAKSKYMCGILCGFQLLVLVFTWSGWISILPVAANIASTVGGYTRNARKVRISGMFINSPLWIIYDIIVGSWAGILDEAVSELSMILSVWRYGWKNLDKVEE